MRPEVQIDYHGPKAEWIDPGALEKALVATFQYFQQPVRELTLQLSTNARVQGLNRRFRAIDSPTDVLAFPAGDEPSGPESGYMGDIIISVPKAAEQAGEQGHSLQDELTLLSIHGLLHLLGFDHVNQEEKQKMWQAQQEILDGLGLGHVRAGDG